MWLVICDAADEAGIWAYAGLKKRGLEPLELVLPEEITFAAKYVHRLSTDQTEFTVILRDGRRINSSQLKGVLNRLYRLPSEFIDRVNHRDRDYVLEELHAFFMSGIFCLPCPVFNPPSAVALEGEWRDLSEWLWLAGQSGLVCPAYRLSSRESGGIVDNLMATASVASVRTVFVVDNEVIAPGAPLELVESCRLFASLARLPLVGINFVVALDGTWVCHGASPLPDLRAGGSALIDALARSFKP